MKHCIIAKFGDMVADKKETLAQVKALFAAAAPVEGVTGIVIHENCVARDNRCDLMIVVEMARDAMGAWDASEIHHQWKAQFGGMLASKAIFDYGGLRATKNSGSVLPGFYVRVTLGLRWGVTLGLCPNPTRQEPEVLGLPPSLCDSGGKNVFLDIAERRRRAGNESSCRELEGRSPQRSH